MHRVLHVQILFLLGLLGCDANWSKAKCDPNLPPGVPGCCPDETKPLGTEGGECRPHKPACDDGMVCYTGTCHPCGAPGQTCCKQSGFSVCNAGADCNNTTDVAFPTCEACGSLGGECCAGDTCPNGGTCNNGTCEAPIDPSCWSGNMAIAVTIVDGQCASQTYLLRPHSIAEAESCADQLLSAAASDPSIVQPVERGPLNTDATKTDMCKDVNDPFGTMKLYHFSQSQLQACMSFWCASCSWTAGHCPS